MKKFALVAAALLLLAAPVLSPAQTQKKPKASHPPIVKHHADKHPTALHPRPTRVKGQHLTEKHPKAFHPKNQHLAEVHPHKAKDTTASHEANKTALKASKPKRHHKFLIF